MQIGECPFLLIKQALRLSFQDYLLTDRAFMVHPRSLLAYLLCPLQRSCEIKN